MALHSNTEERASVHFHPTMESQQEPIMNTSENEPLLEPTSPVWSPPRGFFWIQLGVLMVILA